MGLFTRCGTLLLMLAALASASDFSGRWKFLIEFEPVGYAESLFVLEQKGNTITGNYSGLLGHQTVKGAVYGDTAEFEFTYDRSGKPVRAIYTGTLESVNKMSGKLRFDGWFGRGTWSATREANHP
jgi:hypothetical protein